MGEIDSHRRQLLALINGFQASQAIHAFTVLGLAELIGTGRRGAADVARQTDADPDALRRLLRALAALGVLDEDEAGEFALTPVGEGLLDDAPSSLAAWATGICNPNSWQNWGQLEDSVRTGRTGYQLRLGTDAWTYRAQHPDEGRIFDRAMVGLTAATTEAVLSAYDFSRFGTLVDVGGGQGALLGRILQRYPGARGILFDQPQVVDEAPKLLQALGVLDRCQVVGGSFFESVPSGGDAYLLKSVIHDWYDPEAGQILAAARRAATTGSVLLLVERVLEPANQGAPGKLSDLNMLVNPGGRERTEAEFARLFEAAGFRLERVVATEGPQCVLESAPVG